MEKRKYRVYMLNGNKLLNKDHSKTVLIKDTNKYKIQFSCDLTRNENGLTKDWLVVESIPEYNENATLYQIRKALESRGVAENTIANEMSKAIVYVDFDRTFGKLNAEIKPEDSLFAVTKKQIDKADNALKLQFLFSTDDTVNGFDIRFEDEIRHYVAFDKSGSMSRESRISFIDKTIRDEVNQRLLLDLDYTGKKVTPSKFFSNRGLYMTDADRIEQNDILKWNEESVVVIESKKFFPLLNKNLFQNKKDGSAFEVKNYSEIDNEVKKMMGDIFDGEGIISPLYMKEINAQLSQKYNKLGTATSIQIRMPFTKGVLHQVDFHGFFQEFFRDKKITIKDYFGIDRDLSKVQIILTDGMFKIAKKLNMSADNSTKPVPVNKEEIALLENDPMKYYFSKVNKYDHSLYICNTFEKIGYGKKVEMTYQFLNTLDMNQVDFKNYISKCIRESDVTIEKRYAQTKKYEEDSISSLAPWRQAVIKNKKFLSSSFVKDVISNDYFKNVKDIYSGNLQVSGELRVFSRDLLRLLDHMVEISHIEGISEDEQKQVIDKVRNRIKKHFLRDENFYMPVNPYGIKVQNGEYYALFRSPHLSRYEEHLGCAYVPNKNSHSLLEKYFGHLKSVIMVSKYSIAPEVLGGADFDGDEIKIVADKEIVEAIESGVYNKEIDQNGIAYLERKLPVARIVEIENHGSRGEKLYTKSIPFEVINNTFSNQVGLISNTAIKISRSKDADKNCAGCTIATGLEIDAAKTGNHPKQLLDGLKKVANAITKEDKKSGKSGDYYLDTKKELDAQIEKYNNHHGTNFVLKEKKSGYYLDLVSESKKNGTHCIESVSISPEVKVTHNLDLLPWMYAKVQDQFDKAEKTEDLISSVKNLPEYFFAFETNSDWKKELDKTTRKEISKILSGYGSVKTVQRKLNDLQNKFKNDLERYSDRIEITKILRNQYQEINEPVGDYIESYEEMMNRALVHIEQSLEAKDEDKPVANALDKWYTLKWFYTADKDKENKLREILGEESDCYMTEDDKKLLFNFDNKGHYLLLYALQSLKSEENVKYAQLTNEEKLEATDNTYAKELTKAIVEARKENAMVSVNEVLLAKAKEMIMNLVSDESEALEYIFSINNQKKKMWDFISEDVILDSLYIEGEEYAE